MLQDRSAPYVAVDVNHDDSTQGAGVLECWDNIGLYLASMSRIVSGEIWGAAVACRVCVRYPVCNVSADAACHG